MIHEINVIGISSERLAFESKYVPLISFNDEEQKEAVENYIIDEANKFFSEILRQPFHSLVPLPYPKLITEKDFEKIDISYFYENFFNDLERNDNGKLEAKIKWGITFDEKCTPIQVRYLSPYYADEKEKAKPSSWDKRNKRHYRRYGTIGINGTPVFYYIHFSIQEILDVIKKLPNN
ncbi:hypothetical protein [Floridanema aerugineum]|uniref:Uncharacterized protein n=1 Tax=Floridaenema aerugineum BLCC-F46 TaxID=3153654 RepID=A0ABV4XFA5_9CYAN